MFFNFENVKINQDRTVTHMTRAPVLGTKMASETAQKTSPIAMIVFTDVSQSGHIWTLVKVCTNNSHYVHGTKAMLRDKDLASQPLLLTLTNVSEHFNNARAHFDQCPCTF